jgi:hypothetical protein
MPPRSRLPALALASLLGACSTIGEPPHDWLLLPPRQWWLWTTAT